MINIIKKIKLTILVISVFLLAACASNLTKDVSYRRINPDIIECYNYPSVKGDYALNTKQCIFEAIYKKRASQNLPNALESLGFDCYGKAEGICELHYRNRFYAMEVFSTDKDTYSDSVFNILLAFKANIITNISFEKKAITSNGQITGMYKTDDKLP